MTLPLAPVGDGPSPRPFARRRWRSVVRYGLVVIVLGLMGWTLWHYRQDIGSALVRANWAWLGLAFGLNLAGSLVYLGVWYNCARQLGATGGFRGALVALSVAGAARYLPGGIWPIAGLVYFAPTVGLPRRRMAVLAGLAQLLHLLAAGVIGVGAAGVVLASLPDSPVGPTVWLSLGLTLGLGLLIIAVGPRYFGPLFKKLAGPPALPGLNFWPATSYSSLFWLINGGRLAALALAFGPLELNLWPYLVWAGAVTTVLSGLFFFVPLGLGVIELSLAGWLAVVLPWPTVLAIVTLNRFLRTLNDFFFLGLTRWLIKVQE